jgi:hypothetical protein
MKLRISATKRIKPPMTGLPVAQDAVAGSQMERTKFRPTELAKMNIIKQSRK